MPDDASPMGAMSVITERQVGDLPVSKKQKAARRLWRMPWPRFPSVKVSFRTGMIGLSMLFVVGGALSAHIPWLWISNANVTLLSRDINSAVIANTNREVDDLFRNAANEAKSLQGMIQAGVVDPADPDKLQQAMFAILRSQREFSYVALGLPTGDFVFAQRIDEHELSIGRTKWDATRNVADWTEKRYAVTQDGVFYTRTLQFEDTTNATVRPWYAGAVANPGKVFWTKVFLLTSGRPGLSTGIAYEKDGKVAGVVSVSIELVRLSDYLGGLDLGKDGAAFIIDRDGSLVAFSDQREALGGTDGKLKSLSASFHPMLMVANAALLSSGTALGAIDSPRELTASDANGSYFVTVAPDGRPDWLVGTVIPERNLLGAVQANRQRLVLIGIVALAVVGFLAAWISRALFIRPLTRMIDETQFIERFEIEEVHPVHSVIRELDRLSNSLVRMASGLGSFRRFLPTDLVQELMRQGVTAEVGGERRTVTVLFMDVENFTTLTEQMGHRILPILGEYLSDMTGALMDHRGTIDKFIGDAVMAFWGAPRFNEEHPADACRAALECARRMEERRRAWAVEKKPQLRIRIGVNTGRVVVGNIGSRDRLDYTVIGDAVNLASRLEGLNKVYGTGIIIGAATYELAKYDIIARRLDHVNVKGKEENVAVYELLGMANDDGRAPPAWIAVYERGLELYYGGDIAGARERFTETLKLRAEDPPSKYFLRLCDERLAKVA